MLEAQTDYVGRRGETEITARLKCCESDDLLRGCDDDDGGDDDDGDDDGDDDLCFWALGLLWSSAPIASQM